MPPALLAFFAARPPLEFKRKPERKTIAKLSGLFDVASLFESTPPPKVEHVDTPQEKKARLIQERLEQHKSAQQELIRKYDPHNQISATVNPYATLFIGRLSYETTEQKLRKEFETFGAIKVVSVVTDHNKKPRGYAFMEFEREADMKEAYKMGDGKRIDGRRVLVDVERSRTVEGWLPRRMGGGRGPARFTPKKMKAAALSERMRRPLPGSFSGRDRDNRAPRPNHAGAPRGGYNGGHNYGRTSFRGRSPTGPSSRYDRPRPGLGSQRTAGSGANDVPIGRRR